MGDEPRPRILVIDDDDALRHLLIECLAPAGYETLEAADGAAGIALLETERPDLVLCDLRMPGIDGLGVLAAAQGVAPDTPIVVVTGSPHMDDAIQALKLGAWDYLLKPFERMAVLHHAVRRGLERGRLLEENRRYRRHLEEVNLELAESLRRLQEDEAAGRRVQLHLLPQDGQRLGPYRFQHRVLPSAYLTGDFVDYFAIGADRIAFYIADVSGHGVSSAFVTVLLKSFASHALRAFNYRGDELVTRPAAFLAGLNEHLLGQRLEKHLTIFFGVIDRPQRVLRYCNGGHFPYPVFRGDGRTAYLEQPGEAIGLFPTATYAETSLDLPRRFELTLASDGVLDALGDVPMAEREARLVEALDRDGVTIDDLMNGLGLRGAQGLPDDVALLRVVGEGADDD